MQTGRNTQRVRDARDSACRHLAWLLVGLAAAWLSPSQTAQGSLSPGLKHAPQVAPQHAALVPAEAWRVRLLPPIPLRAAQIRAFEGEPAPAEVRLLDDAADGRLDEHTLLRAALIASGATEPGQIARYERHISGLIEQLQGVLAEQPACAAETAAPQGIAGETPAPQSLAAETAAPQLATRAAEAVLRFMHREILTRGYQLPQTDLRSALEEGRYNCVTATVLYLTLAEAAGLKGCGLEMPKHAMVRLELGAEHLDVETTCAEWFALDPKDRPVPGSPACTSGEAQPTGSPVPSGPGLQEPPAQPAPHAQPLALRALGAAELAAMVYYNQGVDRLAEGRFAAAVAANAKALRLDPQSRTAYGNLLATINNWAVDCSVRGEYLEAIALLERGREIDSAYEPFTLNYRHVARQWSDLLCRQGRFAEAAAVLCEASERLGGHARLTQATSEVFRRWAAARYQAGDLFGAWAVFDMARKETGDAPQWLDCEAALIDRWARRLIEQERFDEAAALCERALRRLPGNRLLEAGRRMALAGRAGTTPVSLGPLRAPESGAEDL